jgi:hypothetical protein
VDTDFTHDLLMASYMLDDLHHTRLAVDAMLCKANAGTDSAGLNGAITKK